MHVVIGVLFGDGCYAVVQMQQHPYCFCAPNFLVLRSTFAAVSPSSIPYPTPMTQPRKLMTLPSFYAVADR